MGCLGRRIILAMLVAALAFGQPAWAATETVLLEDDLIDGLRFFRSYREACESDVSFIPDVYRFDGEIDIAGSCTLLGRRWDILIIINSSGQSVIVSTDVETEKSKAFFEAVDANLEKRWGPFQSEGYADADFNSVEFDGSADYFASGKDDNDLQYWQRWISGNHVCKLYVSRAGKDKRGFTLFIEKLPVLFPKEEKASEVPGDSPLTAHFRATRWGMSLAEVRASEPERKVISSNGEDEVPADTSEYPCIPDVEVLPGFPANANFLFYRDSLFVAGYEYKQVHLNPDDYLDDYAILKKWLTLRYGQPKVDVVSLDGWIQPGDAVLRGAFVADGRLELISRFQAGGTEIVLALTGSYGSTTLTENYHDADIYPVLTNYPIYPGR